jgi:hypothetical protein
MDARQRSLRSRLGAYAALARNDPREINAKARLTYRDSFRNGHSCRLCPVFASTSVAHRSTNRSALS